MLLCSELLHITPFNVCYVKKHKRCPQVISPDIIFGGISSFPSCLNVKTGESRGNGELLNTKQEVGPQMLRSSQWLIKTFFFFPWICHPHSIIRQPTPGVSRSPMWFFRSHGLLDLSVSLDWFGWHRLAPLLTAASQLPEWLSGRFLSAPRWREACWAPRGWLSDTPSVLSSQQPSCHFPHIYPPDPVALHTFNIGTITAPEKHKSEKPEEQTTPYKVTLIFPCHIPALPWNVGFQWLA